MTQAACPLCEMLGGELIFQAKRFRVIRAEEAAFPAFYRLVWQDHVAEFTDLSPADRQHCMDAVACIEQVLREQLQPTKVNLATLGNVVPHLHWHVVARFDWDSHFPAPLWAQALRTAPPAQLAALSARLTLVEAELQRRLGLLA
jgi:diadenosine tetraphosphate (Ap4A) HIT family hydrolase